MHYLLNFVKDNETPTMILNLEHDPELSAATTPFTGPTISPSVEMIINSVTTSPAFPRPYTAEEKVLTKVKKKNVFVSNITRRLN